MLSKMINNGNDQVFTNSILTFKPTQNTIGQKLKYVWRRIYKDKVKTFCSNRSQYHCSLLDWKSLIEVEVQSNGVIIEKKTFGPIQIEDKIENIITTDNYDIWIKVNQNTPLKANIDFNSAQGFIWTLKAKGQILNLPADSFQQGGWEFLRLQPLSDEVILDSRFFMKQWQSFLSKINFQNSTHNPLTLIFMDKNIKDSFLARMLYQSYFVDQSNNHLALQQEKEQNFQQSQNMNLAQNQQQFQISKNAMKQIMDVLYTPNSSTILHRKSQNIQQTDKQPNNTKVKNFKQIKNKTSSRYYTETFKNINDQIQMKKKKIMHRAKSHQSLQKINKNPQQPITNDVLNYYLQNPQQIAKLINKNQELQRQNELLKLNKSKEISQLKLIIKHLNERLYKLQKNQKEKQKLIFSKSPRKDKEPIVNNVPEFIKKSKNKPCFQNVNSVNLNRQQASQLQTKKDSKFMFTGTMTSKRKPQKITNYKVLNLSKIGGLSLKKVNSIMKVDNV